MSPPQVGLVVNTHAVSMAISIHRIWVDLYAHKVDPDLDRYRRLKSVHRLSIRKGGGGMLFSELSTVQTLCCYESEGWSSA